MGWNWFPCAPRRVGSSLRVGRSVSERIQRVWGHCGRWQPRRSLCPPLRYYRAVASRRPDSCAAALTWHQILAGAEVGPRDLGSQIRRALEPLPEKPSISKINTVLGPTGRPRALF
eukprot:364934-Chlamydomonas_euryale.AAC.6